MAAKIAPRDPNGRVAALCLSVFFVAACVGLGEDGGRLVEVQVSDCAELRRNVVGGQAPVDVIELAGPIECHGKEWKGEVRQDRDLLVVGRNGSGLDWRSKGGVWVVASGAAVRFEGTMFLADGQGMGTRLPFVRPEQGAVVSLAGVVVGSRCCGDEEEEGGCGNGQGSGVPNRTIGESAKVGSSEGGAWRVCNSRALCGIGGLDELGRAGGEGNASRIADAGCGEEVLGLLFAEAMPVTRTSGRGVATTASMVVVTLVVIAVTGALACLWYRRRKARANVLDFRDTQITKMGPVLAVPSLSSFSGSNQGLIQGSPVTVRSSEQPTPFQEEPKPPMLMTNIDVSGIRLSIPIGKGAFATVYKASWVGKTVAVKILQHPPDQKTLPEKSLFEAQLGFTVMHANLVHTLGTQTKRCQDLGMITPRSSRPSSTSLDKPMSFAEDFVRGQSRASSDCFSDMADVLKAQGKEEYETWIVMEYCDQGSLQGAIQRGAFFDNAEKTNLRLVDILLTALDIARGMEHLHAMSIVHGDLKPRNVLMKTKKGDVRGYICKVGDFGFSRSVPDCHLTTATCGAVNYMPPELLAQGILTPSADVYSFGVLLWELLVGGNPYPSKTHNEIIVLVTSGRRPNVPSRVPAPCTDLLKRCWHQSRQARPTFTEISTTLKELLADPNMEWRPWRPPTSRGRPPRSSSQMVMGFSFENPLAPPAPLPSPLSSSVVSVLASPLASQGENPLLSPIRSSVASSIISPLPSPLPSPVPSSTASFMATSNPTTYRSEASDLPPPAPVPKGRPSGKDPLSPLQDFPPTPQDIQSGAPLACVTSDSMKNLFLKDLEMSAGQGMLPQFDDLLATVKICQRPRIPTGKKADAVEGSDGGKGSRQRPPVPQSCRKG